MTNLIEIAVSPLKTDAVNRAEQEANKIVAKIKAELEANDWDQRKVADYPKGSDANFHGKLAKYKLVTSITEWDYVKQPGSRTMHGPCIVNMPAERVAKFIKGAKDDAAAQYDAFVTKLVKKIGPVTAATLHGNHVWSYSVLTVTKADLSTENWKTQMIINVSKLGKLFNQWPTRKVK